MSKNVENIQDYKEVVNEVQENGGQVVVVEKTKEGFFAKYRKLPKWAQVAIPVGALLTAGLVTLVIIDLCSENADAVAEVVEAVDVTPEEVASEVVNF